MEQTLGWECGLMGRWVLLRRISLPPCRCIFFLKRQFLSRTTPPLCPVVMTQQIAYRFRSPAPQLRGALSVTCQAKPYPADPMMRTASFCSHFDDLSGKLDAPHLACLPPSHPWRAYLPRVVYVTLIRRICTGDSCSPPRLFPVYR